MLVLGILRGLAGGFFGAAYPSALIYLGDTVAPARRQQAITGLMVGVAVGTAAASAGAGLLADVATWRLPFVLTGSAALVLSVLLARLPEPTRRRHARHGAGLARQRSPARGSRCWCCCSPSSRAWCCWAR